MPGKFKAIIKSSEKRILIDACPIQCGKLLMEREGMTVDRYVELTSTLGVKKEKKLPSEDFEEEVYQLMRKEVDAILQSLKGTA